MSSRLGDRPAARLAAFALALVVTFGAGWGIGELTHDEPTPPPPTGEDHDVGGHR